MAGYTLLKDLYTSKYGGTLTDSQLTNHAWEKIQVNYRKVSTYALKNILLKSCHVFAQGYNNDMEWLDREVPHFRGIRDAIKAELATREHLPNKAERKLIRQQKAKK